MRDSFFCTAATGDKKGSASSIDLRGLANDTIKLNSHTSQGRNVDAQTQEDDLLAAASWELVEKPTVQSSVKAVGTLSTLALLVV